MRIHSGLVLYKLECLYADGKLEIEYITSGHVFKIQDHNGFIVISDFSILSVSSYITMRRLNKNRQIIDMSVYNIS